MSEAREAVQSDDDFGAGFDQSGLDSSAGADEGAVAEPGKGEAAKEKIEESGQEVKPEAAKEDEGGTPAPTAEDPAKEWQSKAEQAEKRAKDHQAAFTKASQKLSELEAKLAELEARGKQEAPAGDDLPEDVKTFFEDYPEVKKAFDLLEGKLATKVQPQPQKNEALEQLQWQQEIIFGTYDDQGNYLEGVPDFLKIAAPNNKDYWDWYAAKGYGTCKPHEAIQRLNEYKRDQQAKVLSAAAAVHDAEAKENAEKLKETLSGGLPAGVRKVVTPKKSEDEDSFESGFNTKKR